MYNPIHKEIMSEWRFERDEARQRLDIEAMERERAAAAARERSEAERPRLNDQHVELVRSGSEALALFRRDNPSVVLELDGANLEGIQLQDAKLSPATLRKANMSNSTISDADLTNARMDGADFSGATAIKTEMARASLRGATLEASRFLECNAIGCDFTNALCKSASFNKAILDSAILTSSNWSSATLDGASMQSVSGDRANFTDASMQGARINKASFRAAIMRRARLHSVDAEDVIFTHANLRGATLIGAALARADLRGIDSRGGGWAMADVDGAHIDRFAILSMADDGGLTQGDLMRAIIYDDALTLRSSYSGLAAWIHGVALVLFLAPYVTFVATRWAMADFVAPTEDAPTIAVALVRYVQSGGEAWRTAPQVTNWSSVSLCIFMAAYNTLRGVLLWKAKALEATEAASGFPTPFSFSKPALSVGRVSVAWDSLWRLARLGFWANLIAIGIHTVHFLSTKVAA
jgi:uncharacterized protein YjbI with pentapeptide repeats